MWPPEPKTITVLHGCVLFLIGTTTGRASTMIQRTINSAATTPAIAHAETILLGCVDQVSVADPLQSAWRREGECDLAPFHPYIQHYCVARAYIK